jgi:hypothetical protein
MTVMTVEEFKTEVMITPVNKLLQKITYHAKPWITLPN